MKTKLINFQITNFRSITDSGIIEIDNTTCLVGVNESGKTNLLLGLWKLNPANNEPIVPLSDYPRKKYVDYESTNGDEIFVKAKFSLGSDIISEIRKLVGGEEKNYEEVFVERMYNGNYNIEFPKLDKDFEITDDLFDLVIKSIPKFVYYSDYGNLDSEIYLPHVISNFNRTDLGEKERAKVRSLKVLFDFVKLKPNEILELGRENTQNPNPQIIEQEREKKKKREILLQSASTKLTSDFREWWKQGEYRFRFQADGNHFRIWVSDDIRTEEVELEGRSKGLQWFFSFFLVFLVESKDTHSNCILLLDEPGISLHPVGQLDLIQFFNSLSKENQLIYTTHSPFLVNPDNLVSVKAVFVDEKGLSSVSSDLRKNGNIADKSVYPIHAAIGLTVSETLLLGCQPVIVEGPSDQIYLQLIKNTLINKGKYKHNREMVFVPAGGVRGMSSIISILSGRDNSLPCIVLDSDKPGKEKEKSLKKELYKNDNGKIIVLDEIIGEGEFEIEDLMPKSELAKVFSKKFRAKSTDDFEYYYDDKKPIVSEFERFAKDNGYILELGWKVELAQDFQRIFNKIAASLTELHFENYKKLFDKMIIKN
jgi:AAA15 family ATPase/GTPase